MYIIITFKYNHTCIYICIYIYVYNYIHTWIILNILDWSSCLDILRPVSLRAYHGLTVLEAPSFHNKTLLEWCSLHTGHRSCCFCVNQCKSESTWRPRTLLEKICESTCPRESVWAALRIHAKRCKEFCIPSILQLFIVLSSEAVCAAGAGRPSCTNLVLLVRQHGRPDSGSCSTTT